MSYREENGQVTLTMSWEDYEEACSVLKIQAAAIHYGRFHQWNTLERCDKPECELAKRVLNRLNEGNPNYTPYQVEAKK